ncbi:hypothetical protein B0H14DRAFT_3163450 [Mycena olivaceomarginata]|nr:hypothetical protein B0H14DRAFT_3163450 [Mycena olivaceomarginata]
MPRVLYVLSPHGGGKREFTTGSDTDWAVETLPPAIVQKLVSNEATNGYVILLEKDPNQENGDRLPGREAWETVAMHESALMATRMLMTNAVAIELFSWESFLNEVMKTVDWRRDWDLIWYGVDLTIDGMERQAEIFQSTDQEWSFVRSLTQIAGKVWPDPEGTWTSRFKMGSIRQLDTIAAEVTWTPRPWTRILKSSKDYAEGTVLKREAKARSDGRAFFTGPSKASEDDITQMLADNASGLYRWFVQEEIPFLRNVGEWRVYLVGCEVVGIVATTPAEENGWKLWVHPVPAPQRELIRAEEMTYPRQSDLKHFARMDIAVIEVNGRLFYFVNEWERGPGTNFTIQGRQG